MRFVYFISATRLQSSTVRKRTGRAHQGVYHGCGKYLGESWEKKRTGEWQRPALSNSNRERLHVSRSGQFVPQVWCPTAFDMVVSAKVKKQLLELQGIEFQPVVFEKLVDLPLPPIADFSEDPDGLYCMNNTEEKIASLPDIPRYHVDIGEYSKLLMPQYYDVRASIEDERPVDLQFGRYHTHYSTTTPLSLALLGRHAMYQVGNLFCLTEQAFEVLAPSLDLEYFLIDFLNLLPKAVYTPGRGIHFPPKPEQPEQEREQGDAAH